jgi:hypothetical protein
VRPVELAEEALKCVLLLLLLQLAHQLGRPVSSGSWRFAIGTKPIS